LKIITAAITTLIKSGKLVFKKLSKMDKVELIAACCGKPDESG